MMDALTSSTNATLSSSSFSTEQMYAVDFKIDQTQDKFTVGDQVSGIAEVTYPDVLHPLSSVRLSLNCCGEVKWTGVEDVLNFDSCYDHRDYHQEVVHFCTSEITYIKKDGQDSAKIFIPFSFEIPKNKKLPTSFTGEYGFLKHALRVTIQPESYIDNVKQFERELLVQAPLEKDLLKSVSACARKFVLLHGGNVSLKASLERRGYAPGEVIRVHLSVQNKSNACVSPRISLNHVQIYQSGHHVKIVENALESEPIVGEQVGSSESESKQELLVQVPVEQELSNKSSLITVKYTVQVTLNIPQWWDLRLNLPVVVTTAKVIHDLRIEKRVVEEGFQDKDLTIN